MSFDSRPRATFIVTGWRFDAARNRIWCVEDAHLIALRIERDGYMPLVKSARTGHILVVDIRHECRRRSL